MEHERDPKHHVEQETLAADYRRTLPYRLIMMQNMLSVCSTTYRPVSVILRCTGRKLDEGTDMLSEGRKCFVRAMSVFQLKNGNCS
nr:hypothetical protein [Escherichia coli]